MPYVNDTGFKGTDTSAAAAAAVAPRSPGHRAAVLAQIKALRSATADEVAEAMAVSLLTVRPRVSELHRTGKLRDTGMRRPTASGHSAVVWEVAP
jgi:DNA-directed RNA polymerase specialized sigma24 family protein